MSSALHAVTKSTSLMEAPYSQHRISDQTHTAIGASASKAGRRITSNPKHQPLYVTRLAVSTRTVAK